MAAAQVICLYFKFGHCKFGDQCRRQHVKETCSQESCDLSSCQRRHPRKCKFFFHFGQCKFDDSCSYSHDVATQDNQVYKAALKDLEVKVKCQEDFIQEHMNEAKEMKARILHLELENIEIKQKLDTLISGIQSIVGDAVVRATGPATEKITSQQITFENQTERIFKSLEEQIAILTNVSTLQSHSVPLSNPKAGRARNRSDQHLN